MTGVQTCALPICEVALLADAVAKDVPVLGICLGGQLLARALGAVVQPAGALEGGWIPIAPSPGLNGDPVLGHLDEPTGVFSWHVDIFDLPEGAVSLASSTKTRHQAFRYGNAWGLLFHPEADAALVEAWMEVPEMVMEAGRAVGLGAAGLLPSQAEDLEKELLRRTGPGLRFFAELVESSE